MDHDLARASVLSRLALTGAAGMAGYDGAGGAMLMAPPTGIAAGMAVETPQGLVAVEALRPGDKVMTLDGAVRSVTRSTRQVTPAESLAHATDARPVRIAAGAVSDRRPRSDVVVAPGQIVVVDGVAAPAHALINAASIRHDAADQPVTYVRLRLDGPRGDVIAIDGIGCDCSGAVSDDAAIARLQARLDERVTPTLGELRGNIAQCDHNGAAGWVLDTGRPTTPVRLDVVACGVVAHGRADLRRPDLEMAGLGNGRCGFAIRFAPPLPSGHPLVLQIRRADDGTNLPGSPFVLPGLSGDGPALVAALERQVEAASLAADRDALAVLLARGIDQMVRALTTQDAAGE
jgi:Hint domain